MPSQAVILQWRLFVFRLVTAVIGGHRIRRNRWSRRGSGLLYRLRFKLALPPFKICDSFRQRLILLSELFGLSLDVRKFTGVAHVRLPKIARPNYPRLHQGSRSLRMMTPDSETLTL
jgi:hypothetical protein